MRLSWGVVGCIFAVFFSLGCSQFFLFPTHFSQLTSDDPRLTTPLFKQAREGPEHLGEHSNHSTHPPQTSSTRATTRSATVLTSRRRPRVQQGTVRTPTSTAAKVSATLQTPTAVVSAALTPQHRVELCGPEFKWPELTAQEKSLTNGWMAAAVPGDVAGHDLGVFRAPTMRSLVETLARCCSACRGHQQCQGVTVRARIGICYLKSSGRADRNVENVRITPSNIMDYDVVFVPVGASKRGRRTLSDTIIASKRGRRTLSDTITAIPTKSNTSMCMHGTAKSVNPGVCVSKCAREHSCDQICESIGKKCSIDPAHTHAVQGEQPCPLLLKQFPCSSCKQGWGADLPAYRVFNRDMKTGQSGVCVSRSPEHNSPFICSARFANSHRLCPCVNKVLNLCSPDCKHVVVGNGNAIGSTVEVHSTGVRPGLVCQQPTVPLYYDETLSYIPTEQTTLSNGTQKLTLLVLKAGASIKLCGSHVALTAGKKSASARVQLLGRETTGGKLRVGLEDEIRFCVVFDHSPAQQAMLSARVEGPEGFRMHVPIERTPECGHLGALKLPSGTPPTLWLRVEFGKVPVLFQGDSVPIPGVLPVQVETALVHQIKPGDCTHSKPPRAREQGHWSSTGWTSAEGCEYRRFDTKAAHACLADKHVVMFGDSHVRGMYSMLEARLQGWNKPNPDKFKGYKRLHIKNISLDYWFTNSAFVSPPDARRKEQDRIDLLFGGYYLADMGTFYMGAEEFAKSAAASTQRLFELYGTRPTFHLPHAVHPSKTTAPFNLVNSWKAQSVFRKALLENFRKLAPDVDLFDSFGMTACREEASTDGNHYVDSVNNMKLDMWLTSIC